MNDNTVQQARVQLNEAEVAVAELESRVVSGDLGVTAEQIAEAHRQVEFLQLRLKSAEREETERAQEDLSAAIAEVKADRDEFFTAGTEALRVAYAGLVKAAALFEKELEAHREEFMDLRRRASLLDLPQDAREWEYEYGEYFRKLAMKEAVEGMILQPDGLAKIHPLHTDTARKRLEKRNAEIISSREKILAERREMHERTSEVIPEGQMYTVNRHYI